MATNTSSPTPSEDNHQNNRDDIMYSALDKVMKNSEQSYDDFLKTFTYLKQGSKEKHIKKEEAVKVTTGLNIGMSVNKSVKLQKENQHHGAEKLLPDNQPHPSKASDDLEEEFDNFIDPVDNSVDDDVDDVEELSDVAAEGYTASFSAGESKVRTGDTGKISGGGKDRLQGNAAAANTDVSNVMDPKLSLDEKSTDKLLMNFLADLQNELNEGKTNDTPNIEPTDSGMDIQNFLDKNKKQKEVVSEEVNFDDDDGENDAMSLLHDDSDKSNVKVKITEEEFNEVVKPDVSLDEEKKARLGNIYRDTLMDSEGKVRTVQAESEAEHNLDSAGVDVDKIMFPGQVEETVDAPVTENDTLLDFKATYRETVGSTGTQMENTDDLIQPFHLDEDFDYDNVVLAPKFSSQDLQQMKTNIKPQTVVM